METLVNYSQKDKKLIKFLLFVVIASAPFLMKSAYAQTQTPSNTPPPVTVTNTDATMTPSPSITLTGTIIQTPTVTEVVSINKTEFSGEITKIDGRRLTVDTSEGVKEVTVPQNVQVKKNSLDSNFDELKVNDKVAVAQSESGEVLALSATSAEIFDFGKMALPIAIGLLLLIGLFYVLFRSRSDGHIKTTTEKVQ